MLPEFISEAGTEKYSRYMEPSGNASPIGQDTEAGLQVNPSAMQQPWVGPYPSPPEELR